MHGKRRAGDEQDTLTRRVQHLGRKRPSAIGIPSTRCSGKLACSHAAREGLGAESSLAACWALLFALSGCEDTDTENTHESQLKSRPGSACMRGHECECVRQVNKGVVSLCAEPSIRSLSAGSLICLAPGVGVTLSLRLSCSGVHLPHSAICLQFSSPTAAQLLFLVLELCTLEP